MAKNSVFIVKPLGEFKNTEEARQFAVDYQDWAGRVPMYMSELAFYTGYFTSLGERFGLTDEFQENGII